MSGNWTPRYWGIGGPWRKYLRWSVPVQVYLRGETDTGRAEVLPDKRRPFPMSLPRTAQADTASRQLEQPVSGRRLLLAVVLMLLLGGGTGIVTWGIVQAVAPSWTATVDFVVLEVAEAYAAICGALLLAFGGLAGARVRLGLRFTSGRDLLQALGIDFVCALAAVLVYLLLSPLFGSPLTLAVPVLKTVTDVTRLPHADLLTLVLIFGRVFLLVPLAEEMFFRGALYGWLRQYLSAPWTILLTAVFFGFEHTAWGMPMPRVFFLVPLAFVYGIGTGWVRERTGSTLNTAVMHVVVDGALLTVASLLILR
jgi:membrane protease YdiL (CAAX protease family)